MKIGLLDLHWYKNLQKEEVNDNKKILINGEIIKGKIERHFTFLLASLIKLLPIILGLAIISIGIQFMFENNNTTIAFSSLFILIIIYKILVILIDYKHDFLVGTNYRLFYMNNDFIFKSTYKPITFEQIEEINFIQEGVFQTLLKYGKIEISVKGKGEKNAIIFNYAKNAINTINSLSKAHADIILGKTGRSQNQITSK